jgi:hypothetical protein
MRGSNIDNARITYTFSVPQISLIPIYHGKQEYHIQVKPKLQTALSMQMRMECLPYVLRHTPDSSIGKNTEPFFNFKVALSTTDANGETREASTICKGRL